ncbi:MAG: AAA family ATPase [Anaerolineae bacterium]
MQLTIPELALVVLIGASGSGRSTFAHRHFKPTEILSLDFFRALVSDDEADQNATDAALAILHFVVAKRLEAGKLTVVDANNDEPRARAPLVALARQYYTLPVAIALDLPEKLLGERNRHRSGQDSDPEAIAQQVHRLSHALPGLYKEGFRRVHVLSSPEQVESAEIARDPLPNNRKADRGPFDIIGDVHGCFDELISLLRELGYTITGYDSHCQAQPPAGRSAIFVGDLVDRGPKIPQVLHLVMDMVAAGQALCVPGNHDMKLVRKLSGRTVEITNGLAETLEQLESEPLEFKERVRSFLGGLPSHYVLDGGNLVVAHAGLKQPMQGRDSNAVYEFALYGETTGEIDEFGLPVRLNWAADYHGSVYVVYGHTPVPSAEWLNRTMDIDTGCVFGGKLTALRYPEMELISVPAARTYAPSKRPFLSANKAGLPATSPQSDLLD